MTDSTPILMPVRGSRRGSPSRLRRLHLNPIRGAANPSGSSWISNNTYLVAVPCLRRHRTIRTLKAERRMGSSTIRTTASLCPAVWLHAPSSQSAVQRVCHCGLVCSFFTSIIGLIFSIIGLNQIKRQGGKGKAWLLHHHQRGKAGHLSAADCDDYRRSFRVWSMP